MLRFLWEEDAIFIFGWRSLALSLSVWCLALLSFIAFYDCFCVCVCHETNNEDDNDGLWWLCRCPMYESFQSYFHFYIINTVRWYGALHFQNSYAVNVSHTHSIFRLRIVRSLNNNHIQFIPFSHILWYIVSTYCGALHFVHTCWRLCCAVPYCRWLARFSQPMLYFTCN